MRVTNLFQRIIGFFGISALAILFFACPAEPKIQEQQNDGLQIPEQQKAAVTFSVTDNVTRTVLPQVSLDDVAAYKLLGGINGESETVLVDSFTATGTSVSLDPGTWNFTLNAFDGSGGNILQGKIQNRQINLTGTNLISFTLSAVKSGAGAIQITLNFPETAGITQIKTNGDIAPEVFNNISGGSFVYTKNEIESGDYFINFELYCGDGLRTAVSELVLVRSSLTSSKTITLVGEDLKPMLTGTVSINETTQGAGAGQITVAMWDSASDGWDGNAALRINVNGTNLSSNARLASGSGPEYYYFNVNAGDIVTFYWVNGGQYDRECAFAVYNGSNQPNPPFNPNSGSWSPANDPQGRVLLYKQYSSSGTVGNGTLMGSFTVSRGTAICVDQTLTVNTGNLNGSGDISYQWNRGETAIPGATGNTYTVQAADMGFAISVTVTRIGRLGSVTSAPTAAVQGTVTITGTAQVGQTLTADTANLGGSGTITYQWKRNANDATTDIGTDSNSYEIVVADVGSTITVTATCTGSSVTSPPTVIVQGTVTITGTAQVGQTLTADTANLGGSGTITYQWKRGTTNIGTNSSTYLVAVADVGSTITVTATRTGSSATSSPTDTVQGTVTITGNALIGQTLTANTANLGGSGAITYQWKRGTTNIGSNSSTYTVQAADLGSAITVTATRTGISTTSPPTAAVQGTVTISGTAQQGQTLTANTANLGGTGTITYQWKRGTTNIGTNSSTYLVVAADVGYTITVTATRADSTATSAPTATVILPSLTGTVSITGTTQVGQTLTANTGSLGGTGTISYQWRRGTTNIGTNNSTYTLVSADASYTINVVVTRAGYSGSVTSSATATITLPPLTGTVSITGNVQVGQTLTANTANLDGSGTISYQWKRAGTAISGATNSTYTVQSADVDNTISVTVTRSGYSGDITSTPVSVVIVLPFSTIVSGSITTANTINRYMVVLAQAGTLSVNLTSPGGSTALPNNGADVKWLNSGGASIRSTSSGFSFPYNDFMDLAAGTYYIEIIMRAGAGNTGLYNIRADYFVSEVEPNNTRATAQTLLPGQTVKGTISTTDTIDIFKYVLTEPGRLTVDVDLGSSSSGGLYYASIRWLDVNGVEIKGSTSSTSYNSYMDFEAGTYYIEVAQYMYNPYTGTYNLRGDFTAAGNNEVEPNNTHATAQLLSIGQTVKGFISYQDTIDMYKYVLTQPGRFTVDVDLGSSSSGGLYYASIRWLDVNGVEIKGSTSSTSYNSYMDFEAGTYYIEVAQYMFNPYTGTYNLRGDFTVAGNNEVEPNNTRAEAQLLTTSGQTVKGFISYQDTIDMYRVVLTQARRLTVNINLGSSSSGGLYYAYIRWLDVNGVEIKESTSSTSYNSYMDLTAGTYYIEITPYMYNPYTGTYNLTVTWN